MAVRSLLVFIGTLGVLVSCATSEQAPTTASAPTAAPPSGAAQPPPVTASPTSHPSADHSRLRVRTAGWLTDFTRATVDLGEILSGGPPKDGIPSIDAPRFESIGEAQRWLVDTSPVISLQVGSATRAYPLAILIWHEVVNDTLGGVPVVVTFCPLCNTALVFERRLEGVTYEFGTTGNLRYSDLVMYDRQTESWWQQATGEAIVGTLSGSRLRFLPAQIVSFASFEESHPDAEVLSRETGHERDYGSNPYVGYDTIFEDPFMFLGEVDGRLSAKERVVTVGEGNRAVAYPYSELRQTGVATGEIDARPYVVLWQPGTASPLAEPYINDGHDVGASGVFWAEHEGGPLNFARAGGEEDPIRDLETGTTWSVTGLAVAGPLAGTRLQPVVHGDHFWFAWAAFAPQTTIWTAQ